MILQMPHSFRWGDRAGVVISKILAESVYGRCQRLACYVPMSGGERQIRHFSSAFILMYTVSFIIYITVQLTLLCVLFDFYWIHIKICGESVPLRPDRTEKILKEPGGPYQIGKVLRALFSPKKVCSKRLYEATKRRWANGKKKCSLCPRASRVNQNGFTLLDQNRESESNLIHSHTAPKRALYWADVRHRTRIPAARENRRLGRFRGCVAARAVQLNTRE